MAVIDYCDRSGDLVVPRSDCSLFSSISKEMSFIFLYIWEDELSGMFSTAHFKSSFKNHESFSLVSLFSLLLVLHITS